ETDIMATHEGKGGKILVSRKGEKNLRNLINTRALLPQMFPLDDKPFRSKVIVPLSYQYTNYQATKNSQANTQIIINAYITRDKFMEPDDDDNDESSLSFEGFKSFDKSIFD